MEEEVKVENIVSPDLLDLSRQAKLVPFEKINNWTIKVFGVGSVGSHVVKTLAKTGFKNIEVYDMDTVETENIAAQAFDFTHLGMKKVDACAKLVKEGAGIEIITHDGEITKDSTIAPEPNTVYCCFFDSFEGRKLVFDKIKEYPITFVDGRIGGFNMRHYLVDCNNEEEVKAYSETLETTATSELECGEKASAPINAILAGEIVMNIINYINKDTYTKICIGSAKAPKSNIYVLSNQPTLEEE